MINEYSVGLGTCLNVRDAFSYSVAIDAEHVDITKLGQTTNLQTYLLENESKIMILQHDNQQLARKLDEIYYRRGVSY